MQKKVLIVDDSALMRRVLSDIINTDTRFHVTRVATHGLDALKLLVEDKEEFDAIILDINMPKMNGIEFLEELESRKIKATVVIVSTVAIEGAKETIRALELGAFDFVTKPESFYEVKSDGFKNKLIECLSVATKLDQVSTKNEAKESREPLQQVSFEAIELKLRSLSRQKSDDRMKRPNQSAKKVIALACSTGGPKALQQVIPYLPKELDCSVLIVQHMPEGFTYSLAHRLNEMSKITVKEAEHGEILKKGVAYIAQGGRQMRVITERGVNKLSVTLEPPRNGLKPCADIMYESLLASDYEEILCIVLTGMGGDGTNGIRQLSETKNIYVIAQDEETSTVYGMPKVIQESGLVNEVLPLQQIADAITNNLGVPKDGC